ncbi:MAG: AbgT family transporter, partial [Gammaproteobacteria bacterium]|nr:AbgT family transporter [Gammaproteobacteria bacterium]
MNEARRAARLVRLLDRVEALGNRLPDPAVLFLLLLIAVWILSAALAQFSYSHIDPRTGTPLEIQNLATPSQLTQFLSGMVATFVGFHPLGVVLLAMLGIGVADHTGFIRTGLKALMNLTSKAVVTPMLLLIAIISHTAVDAGYVLVIPLGAVIFQAAGRHPLAGIAAAFAGVSGGFSANFVPSALDPMLQGITQAGAQIIDPDIQLNPLNNWFFTSASTALIVGLGWYLTDRVIEPRLSGTALDGDLAQAPELNPLTTDERRGLIAALAAMGLALLALFVSALPESSPWRAADGQLTVGAAPLMRS